jgi:hypothetical protein
MSDLSPAAEAVLNAVTLNRYDAPYYACPKSIGQIKSDVAGALRAAADQVVPEPNDIDKGSFSLAAIRNRCKVRDQLLAIAAELEGQ